MTKELLSTAAAIAFTLAAYIPYIRSIRQGRTRPHIFSWVIWTLNTVVVFLALLTSGGGLGAYPIAVNGLLAMFIVVEAYRRRTDVSISRVDWTFLGVAVLAILCWILTSDPLLAVVLLTAVELAGFGPTFKTAYLRPNEERMGFYALSVLRHLLTLAALSQYSWTTTLYSGAKVIVAALLVAMIAYRRRELSVLTR